MAVAAVITLCGCAQVGGLAQAVGSGLTDYNSKDPDSFVGKVAGVGGNVYTVVGGAISRQADPVPAAVTPATAASTKKKGRE